MRRVTVVLCVVGLLGLVAIAYFLRPVNGPERDLTLVGDVARGDYLITVGGCVSCHTDAEAGRAELSGGPGLRTAFGAFHAPNITPDRQYGIGGWSLADFSKAMSDGEGPGFMNHFYPAFPYDSYTLMSDQEIADLYAALMAREPVAEPSVPHQVGFPFNIRALLAGWKNLYFAPERFEPVEGRSDQWNRGRYLVYGPGHCVACHTPRDALGGRDDSRALQGSSGGPSGRVPGITVADLEEEGYDKASLVDALVSGFTPGFDVLGREMAEVIETSTSQWTEQDLDALATFLLDSE